jgi:hypothetical protein
MFARALLAFLACPGIVAIAVPVAWLVVTFHTQLVQPLGLVPLAGGFVALLWCVRDFYVSGYGNARPVGAAAQTGCRRPLSLHAQAHVRTSKRAVLSGLKGTVFGLFNRAERRFHRASSKE